ncbi:MAG: hypothetical protein LDL41_23630 [Coleofasciculus sp. S288]|nr:hypothetical protein [Coleofasciculus sp. S288]
MTQPKLFSKPSLPTKASQELEIPPRLHPVVRDVVESLALRDVDCAKRYLETYIHGVMR